MMKFRDSFPSPSEDYSVALPTHLPAVPYYSPETMVEETPGSFISPLFLSSLSRSFALSRTQGKKNADVIEIVSSERKTV